MIVYKPLFVNFCIREPSDIIDSKVKKAIDTYVNGNRDIPQDIISFIEESAYLYINQTIKIAKSTHFRFDHQTFTTKFTVDLQFELHIVCYIDK